MFRTCGVRRDCVAIVAELASLDDIGVSNRDLDDRGPCDLDTVQTTSLTSHSRRNHNYVHFSGGEPAL